MNEYNPWAEPPIIQGISAVGFVYSLTADKRNPQKRISSYFICLCTFICFNYKFIFAVKTVCAFFHIPD